MHQQENPALKAKGLKLHREFSRAMVNNPRLSSFFEPFIQTVLPAWSNIATHTRVVGLRDESPTTFSLVLKPSRQWSGFDAGQFVELAVQLNGRRVSRYFTISSSPNYFNDTGLIELTIQEQPGGLVTPYLRQSLRAGDYIQLSHAQGNFTQPESSPLGSQLFIAGGSGITPFRSMLEEMLHQRTPRETTLLYYARHEHEHLFAKEFSEVTAKHPQVKVVYISSKSQGRFNHTHLQQHYKGLKPSDVFICGPAGMIQSAQNTLIHHGVPRESLHCEYFGPPPREVNTELTEGRVSFTKSNVLVSTSSTQEQSILALAESSGLKPNHGCRMGVCGQCRSTKSSGIVRNLQTGSQSDTGCETIQLCISVPVGDVTIAL